MAREEFLELSKGNGARIRRRILIVEDEPINRSMLRLILERDYEVYEAENGLLALDVLKEHGAELSLVLLDLVMPEMGGNEVLRKMKQEPAWRNIPVIVLTSERLMEGEILKEGADDFISKPFSSPDAVSARVRHLIDLYEKSTIIKKTETDELTGLFTREYFFEYAQQTDQYYPDADMDAIVLNINNFHLLNELYGREYGDEVLKKVAEHIREQCSGDIGFGCRSDGDTFYLYLRHRDDHIPLREYLRQDFTDINNRTSRIRLRMGVYEHADKTIDLASRFDRAAIACNSRRNNYTDLVGKYDESMHEKEIYSARLIQEMDRSLKEKHFKVFYQPKYDITGDEPVLSSAEALIRWIHPELGMISPGAFIPLYEENGLIQKLDHYVWEEVGRQIREWKDRYGISVPVSVNVSRIDIYDPELRDRLLGILKRHGINSDDYHLEITESAYTDNSAQIIETVEVLRNEGYSVEMDDFGSGYSSLNMLSEIPIDAIKLDMKFIRNITKNAKDLRLVELIVDIARFLKVPTIAEGVEDEEQYRLLKKSGVDVIQGYYFSKPVPPEEFEEHIAKRVRQMRG